MNNGSDDATRGEQLSALVDGELDAAQVSALCGAWREDADVRRRWHDYQLIGDVLRSDDLATAPAHDSNFLAALRNRLADEPVVIAPAALQSPQVERRRCRCDASRRAMAVGAVAAGFVAVVAGALTFSGLPTAQAPDPVLARSSGATLGGARRRSRRSTSRRSRRAAN